MIELGRQALGGREALYGVKKLLDTEKKVFLRGTRGQKMEKCEEYNKLSCRSQINTAASTSLLLVSRRLGSSAPLAPKADIRSTTGAGI